ncbi:alpha-keto acid decarboxylase family protein [Acetobacteraceae bacterium]|nr:alpha-keto acid decarboxylase family protein [Acetobacteraceae bacterium]
MISIGKYLINRLYEAGLRRIYGVPGDFNLNFLELLIEDGRIEWVGCCNELNAAYAADGDARISGFAAVLTTYGVGDLSALQPLAGSFCENVPILSISGLPSLNAVKNRFPLHHTLLNGDYDNVMAAHRPFTAYQARLTPEGKAGQEIDRLIEGILREKKPGYLQLPSDVTQVLIPESQQPLDLIFPPSDPETLRVITAFLVEKLNASERPFIAMGSLIGRYGLQGEVLSLCQKLNIPYCLTADSKTLLPRKNPLFAGQYAGKGSIPLTLYHEIAHSDCIIAIGIALSDLTSGLFSNDVSADIRIELTPYGATTGFAVAGRGLGKSLTGARLKDVLDGVKAKAKPHSGRALPQVEEEGQRVDQKWGFEAFLYKMQSFVSEKICFLLRRERLPFPSTVLTYQMVLNMRRRIIGALSDGQRLPFSEGH